MLVINEIAKSVLKTLKASKALDIRANSNEKFSLEIQYSSQDTCQFRSSICENAKVKLKV